MYLSVIFMIILNLVDVQAFRMNIIPTKSILKKKFLIFGRVTPNNEESMDEFRKSLYKELEEQNSDPKKLGGRELLETIVKKWGVAYDVQLRKSKPFGDGSENIYLNIM